MNTGDGCGNETLKDAELTALPEQTTIICNKGAEYCLEMKISFVTVGEHYFSEGTRRNALAHQVLE